MGQLLLVRHGQASWGSDDYDVLSDLGHTQAKLLGESFAQRGITADVLLHGGLKRQIDTLTGCAAAAGWSAEPQLDPGWEEYDSDEVLSKVAPPHDGVLDKTEVQTWVETGTDRWTSGHDDYILTFDAFTARVEAALAALPDNGTVVAVSSGGPIAWAAASLLADDRPTRIALWRRLNVVCANSGVTRIVAGRRGRTLVSFNEHTHLDGVDGALSYR